MLLLIFSFISLIILFLCMISLVTWCKEPTHWKRPWCWERLKAGGEEDDRGKDSWMVSPTWWTWVWASSGSWWRTGKPGKLQSMAREETDVTEPLNNNMIFFIFFWYWASWICGLMLFTSFRKFSDYLFKCCFCPLFSLLHSLIERAHTLHIIKWFCYYPSCLMLHSFYLLFTFFVL